LLNEKEKKKNIKKDKGENIINGLEFEKLNPVDRAFS
jgi:hypothetical protein